MSYIAAALFAVAALVPAQVAKDEDYKIGARDVIEIQVEDAPELSGTFRVSAAGTITMHFIGRLEAVGLTPEELAGKIADRLRGRYLKDPRVTVTVKQYNSRSFFIQGAVRNPNVYYLEGRVSLLNLITVAGGLTDNHGSTAFIIRQAKTAADPSAESEPEPQLIKVNIAGLLKGRFDQNVTLEPGDIVNIPAIDVFFVGGEVRKPGSFPLKDGTTLRQAISMAEGTTIRAALDRGVIFREDPSSGKRQEIRVDIGAIMSGKKEDINLMANDIIIVPNSRAKSVGAALLTAFGIGAATRLPRY
jgi:polysaccharide export outer membrane protein